MYYVVCYITNTWIFFHIFHMFFTCLITESLNLESFYWHRQFRVSKKIFGIISIAGGSGRGALLAKKLKINSQGRTFTWHSKVANLHICSQLNFAHQLRMF